MARCGVTVISSCAQLLMRNRHALTRATSDASHVAVRPSSISSCAQLLMHRKLRCDRHKLMRPTLDVSHIAVRPSSVNVRNFSCIASCGATVMSSCAHLMHGKLRRDRHKLMRAIPNAQPSYAHARNSRCIASCDTIARSSCAKFLMHCKLRCDRRKLMRAIPHLLHVDVGPPSAHVRNS